MTDDPDPVIHGLSEGGIAAAHPAVPAQAVLVGSSTGDEQNRITAALIPIGCWRVDDVRFAFDSSFVRPELAEEVRQLARLREAHKMVISPALPPAPEVAAFPPMSIFGHADPAGNDDYNKTLSGRRATAIYGLLTRSIDLWEQLYSQPFGGDDWGIRSVQIALIALGFTDSGSGGTIDAGTRSAIKAFQTANGLGPDGIAGPNTRSTLFAAYMDFLGGKDFVLSKKDDFIAGGTDPGGKGDYQGCGEFNPTTLFSREEERIFSKPENLASRNVENAPNRRVMVLLFRPGMRVLANKWPCPRVKEGVAGCHKRFWSDGEKRRTDHLSGERREFDKSHDTFACRFYHRLASESPCEALLVAAHISVLLRSNSGAVPLANLPYKIAADRVLEGKTDKDGLVDHDNVPPGDYAMELNGKAVDTLVPTLPKHLSRRTLRISGFVLIGDDAPQSLSSQDANASIVSNASNTAEGGWTVVRNG